MSTENGPGTGENDEEAPSTEEIPAKNNRNVPGLKTFKKT